MKVSLEIPDETVCIYFILGLQDDSGWGIASYRIEEPKEGCSIQLTAEKENGS